MAENRWRPETGASSSVLGLGYGENAVWEVKNITGRICSLGVFPRVPDVSVGQNRGVVVVAVAEPNVLALGRGCFTSHFGHVGDIRYYC